MSNIILGGGIGGLTTAFYLSKQVKQGVKLIEASQRLGGWIRSNKSESGCIFEQGPHTVRPLGEQGVNLLRLIDELNLQSELKPISRANVTLGNRMIYVNDQLHVLRMPQGFFKALFKKIPPFSKPIYQILLKEIFIPKKPLPDESVYDFVERRLGKEFADLLISPLVCGICAGDAKEISVKLMMGNVFEAEQQHGSIMKGYIKNFMKGKGARNPMMLHARNNSLVKRAYKERWAAMSFQNGLETLPRSLTNYLEDNDVEISLGQACKKIEFKGDKALVTTNEKTETANHLYCSLPSKEVAKLIGGEHHFLKEELSAIPFVTVGVVNLEYEGEVLPEQGFGVLVPPNQNLPILGVIFDSCLFPHEGKTVITVMMGGKWFEQQFGAQPDKKFLLKTALEQVKKTLNIVNEPKHTAVSILRDCIPQYVIGHAARVERIKNYIKEHKLPLTLVGFSYDGVGIGDVIYSARQAVDAQLCSL